MILFIDDEKREMDSYVRELELSGYQVSFQKNVDAAIDFFEGNFREIELLVLDIMMPPGEVFKNVDTEGGLTTGIHVYKRVRQRFPTLPVVILTNVTDENIIESFRKEAHCRFLSKEEYLPFELVDEIKEVLLRAQGQN